MTMDRTRTRRRRGGATARLCAAAATLSFTEACIRRGGTRAARPSRRPRASTSTTCGSTTPRRRSGGRWRRRQRRRWDCRRGALVTCARTRTRGTTPKCWWSGAERATATSRSRAHTSTTALGSSRFRPPPPVKSSRRARGGASSRRAACRSPNHGGRWVRWSRMLSCSTAACRRTTRCTSRRGAPSSSRRQARCGGCSGSR